MKEKKNNHSGMAALLGTAAIVVLGIALIYATPFVIPRHGYEGVPLVLVLKNLFSLASILLLVYLVYAYLRSYLEIKSEFTLGLVFFLASLMLFIFATSPLLIYLLELAGGGPMMMGGVGVFSVIPLVFSTLALAILAYLSTK